MLSVTGTVNGHACPPVGRDTLFSKEWNHLEIAIKSDFWYKEVNFRGRSKRNQLFRDVIKRLKTNLIKKGTGKYFITIA